MCEQKHSYRKNIKIDKNSKNCVFNTIGRGYHLAILKMSFKLHSVKVAK